MSEPRSEPEPARPPQRELVDSPPAHPNNVSFSSLAEGANIVEVQVRDKVLWINDDAYPVSNIGHIGSGKWRPNFVAIWGKFFRSSVIVLIAAFIVAQIASFDQQNSIVVMVRVVAICTILGFLLSAIDAS